MHQDWRGHGVIPEALLFLHAASARPSENLQSVSQRKHRERSLHWISRGAGGMGEDCGLSKNLELGSEAVNLEGSHHERLGVSEVQGPLHPKGGERAGVWNDTVHSGSPKRSLIERGRG